MLIDNIYLGTQAGFSGFRLQSINLLFTFHWREAAIIRNT